MIASPGASPTGNAAVNTAFNSIMQAMQGHDLAALRGLIGNGVGAAKVGQFALELQTCVPSGSSVKVLNHSENVNGNTATVNMTLQLTDSSGKSQTVQRQLQLTRQSDGSWAITSLPQCPL